MKRKVKIPDMPEGWSQVRLGDLVQHGDQIYWSDGWREAKEDVGFRVRMGMLVIRKDDGNGKIQK
jgi:hypothetical protein